MSSPAAATLSIPLLQDDEADQQRSHVSGQVLGGSSGESSIGGSRHQQNWTGRVIFSAIAAVLGGTFQVRRAGFHSHILHSHRAPHS